MYLNDPEDASSVKNNIKYAKLKSNVSLSLSLMSELKKSFLISHQLWKHQADVNSSNVGSFNNPETIKLANHVASLPLLAETLPARLLHRGARSLLLLFSIVSLAVPLEMAWLWLARSRQDPCREGKMMPAWSPNLA